ncbi:MAG: CDP-diacylglycerol--glycerol-3-phosphate 3-phosphatidyltransferase, partial [Pseudomonadota bacterium]
QMVAIAVLFAKGVFEHYFGVLAFGMGTQMVADVLAGREEDLVGLTWKYQGMLASWWGGVILLWIAAILTLITGWDYFRKSLPFLKEPT